MPNTVCRFANFPISPTTQSSFMNGWFVIFHKLLVITFVTFSLKLSCWEYCRSGPRILDWCGKKTLWGTTHLISLYTVDVGDFSGPKEMNDTSKKMTHKAMIYRSFTVHCIYVICLCVYSFHPVEPLLLNA